MKKDVLITLADKGYLEQAKQLFYSAVAKGGWQGDMLLLAYEVSDADVAWFADRGIIIFHCPKWDVRGGSNGTYTWPPVVWHKMHIWKPYFKQWKTIVFFDSDIIIRASIRALAEVDRFSAVRCDTRISDECVNPVNAFLTGMDWRLLREIDQKYDLKRNGFNSGLIAFPSSLIEDGMFEKVLEVQRTYSHMFLIPEQVTFNLLIRDWKPLPNAYSIYPINVASYTHMRPEDIQGIAIHFILENPWIKGHPFYKEWKESYDKACASPVLELDGPLVTMTRKQMEGIDAIMATEFRKGRLKRMKKNVMVRAEWCVGIAGLAIRRVSPRTYFFLRRLLDALMKKNKSNSHGA